MDKSSTNVDKTIQVLLNELKTSEIIDLKATKKQLDKLYYLKYIKKRDYRDFSIKKYDDIVLLYGLIFKQGVSKPIRFDQKVFEYLNENRKNIIDWLSKYQNYEITNTEKSKISSYTIFDLILNEYGNNLIIKMNANDIDTFEHDEIHPYFIRVNIFVKLLTNMPKIMTLIENA